mgnify:CR=1|jgi:hypothetical protein
MNTNSKTQAMIRYLFNWVLIKSNKGVTQKSLSLSLQLFNFNIYQYNQ